MATADKHDLVEDIISDHREVEAVFSQIEAGGDDGNATLSNMSSPSWCATRWLRNSTCTRQFVGCCRTVTSWPITSLKNMPRPKRS